MYACDHMGICYTTENKHTNLLEKDTCRTTFIYMYMLNVQRAMLLLNSY